MSHKTWHADFDPNTQEVEEVGHFHAEIGWESKDKQGHNIDIDGAEAEVHMLHVDEDNYRVVANEFWPSLSAQIDVSLDGNYEVKKRQRLPGGPWSDFTQSRKVKIDLQPAMQANPVRVEVLDCDGHSTGVRVHFTWPDRDVQGNVIDPAQALVSILHPGGHPVTGWVVKGVTDYGDPVSEYVDFRVPSNDGVSNYLARVRITNICQILNEPSEPTPFKVDGTELASGGSLDIIKGCL